MHVVSFLAKRLHLTTTAFGQGLLTNVAKVEGMTPARFDLLCLLRQSGIALQRRFPRRVGKGPPVGSDEAGMRLSTVILRLGLHPSTVSKMIRRLVEMGWVRVFRDYPDRRFKIVECTPLGLRRTWQAMRRVFRGRLMLSEFERIIRKMIPAKHVLDGIDDIVETLSTLAWHFGNSSTLLYEWGSKYEWEAQP